MTSTKIEWATDTWNPIRARVRAGGRTGWHCEKVSAGCAHCYAETFNGRMLPNGGTGLAYGKRQRAEVETFVDEDVLRQPLSWRKPRRVFVCSMTDLFGEWVTDEQIADLFAVMAKARDHVFMVLTKRAERMRAFVGEWDRGSRSTFALLGCPLPLPNVWLGVSVENQAQADELIPHLLQTPAAIRFVSAEPLIGELDLRHWVDDFPSGSRRLDWCIVGGESGPGARPCDLKWVRSIVAQTRGRTACFVKQLGTRAAETCGCIVGNCWPCSGPRGNGAGLQWRRTHDRKGGNPAEWPEGLRVREFPNCARGHQHMNTGTGTSPSSAQDPQPQRGRP